MREVEGLREQIRGTCTRGLLGQLTVLLPARTCTAWEACSLHKPAAACRLLGINAACILLCPCSEDVNIVAVMRAMGVESDEEVLQVRRREHGAAAHN